MQYHYKTLLSLFFLFCCLIAKAKDVDPNTVKTLNLKELETLGLRQLVLPNGELFMPKHDGKRHFIPSLMPDSTNKGGIPPTKYAIDEAVAKALIIDVTNINNLQLTAEQLSNLPITLRLSKASDIQGKMAHYDITILAAVYEPDGVYFDIGVKFVVPDLLADNAQQIIYFGVTGLRMPYQGGTLSGKLQLIEAPNFTYRNWEFSLGPKTELVFECGKFQSFTLDAMVGVDRSLIVPEDPTGKPLVSNAKFSFKGMVTVQGWNDMILAFDLANGVGFHPADMPSIGFWFGDGSKNGVSKIVVDLSSGKNSPDMPNIDCFTNPEWKGIYIQQMSMRFPSFLKKKDGTSPTVRAGVEKIVLGNHGFYGVAFYEDSTGIINLADGKFGDGWDISLTKVSFGKICGSGGYNFSMEGKVRPPTLEEKEALRYVATYTNSAYSFNVIIPESLNLEVLKGRAILAARSANLTVRNGIITGSISLSGCLRVLDMSNELALGLQFSDLKLTPQKPFISGPAGLSVTTVCDLGNSPQGINFQIAGFALQITTGPLRDIVDADGKIKLPLGVAVSLGGNTASAPDTNGTFFAKGTFLLEGELEERNGRKYMKNTHIGVSEVVVKADFKVFKLNGVVRTFNDDPRYGKGFKGDVKLELSLAKGAQELKGEVNLLFGRKDDYKYWFVNVGVGIDPGIPIGGVVSLTGLVGGGYKNMAMTPDPRTPSGFRYDPQKGHWGFRAGIKLGATGKVPAQVNGMFEVVGDNTQGHDRISTVYLIADVSFNIDNVESAGLNKLKDGISKGYSKFQSLKSKLDDVASKVMTTVEQSVGIQQDTATIKRATDGFSTPSPNQVGASAIIWYGVDSKTLHGILHPKVNITMAGIGGLNASGYGIIHFSPSQWYVHIGKSGWNDRIGLHFKAPGIDAAVTAYFMIGHGITGIPTPVVPEDFRSLFASNRPEIKDTGENTAKYKSMEEGQGIAMGVAVKVDATIGVPVVASIDATAGAGFDFVLAKGIEVCKNEPANAGINGWRGGAQLYGYAKVGITILFAKIAEIGLGLSLKMASPNPTYADGRVRFFVKVWRSKLDLNARVTIGGQCEEPTPPPNLVAFSAVKYTYPTDSSAEVPIVTKVKIGLYNFEEFETTSSIVYKPTIQSFQVTANGSPLAGTLSEPFKDEKGEWTAYFTPAQVLPKNTTFQTSFEVFLKDDKGVYAINKTTQAPLKQTKTFSFKTGYRLRLSEVALKAVPLRDQYNVYMDDELPFITIDPAVVPLLEQECSGCNFEVKIVDKNGTVAWSQSIVNIRSQLNFDESFKSELAAKKTYELQLWGNPEGVAQSLYDKHYFRVSQYVSFGAKITDINTQKKVNQYTDGYPYFLISDSSADFEGFSTTELNTQIKMEALDSDWYSSYNNQYNIVSILGRNYWDGKRRVEMMGYEQSFKIDMKAGQIVREKTGNSTQPQWSYRPFDQSVVMYQNAFSSCKSRVVRGTNRGEEPNEPPNCPDIPDFEAGEYGIDLNYVSASNRIANGQILFRNENTIPLRDLRYAKRILELTCTPSAYDSRVMRFDWKSLKSNQEPVLFALQSDMTLKIALGETSDRISIRPLVQDSTKGDFSAFASKLGCPTNAQVSLTGEKSFRYELRVLTAPAVPTEFKPTMVSYCQPNNVMDKEDFVEEGQQFVVAFYESAALQEPQKLRSPLVLTLNNGTSITIPAGKSRYELKIGVNDQCPAIQPNASVILGDITRLNAPNHIYGFAVSVMRPDAQEVCGLVAYTETVFSPVTPLVKGESVSATQGTVKTKPADGFYKRLLPNNIQEYVQITDGRVADMGTCGAPILPCSGVVSPPILTAISATRVDFGNTIQLKAVGCTGTVRWSDEGKTGTLATFTPTASKRYTAVCDVAGCTVSGLSNVVEITVVGALTLSTDAVNNTLCASSFVTLKAQGCGGTMTWKGGGKTYTGTAVAINDLTQTTVFETECVVGEKSLKGSNLTVNVLALPTAPQIDSTAPAFICFGNQATLQASGCGYQYKWSEFNQNAASIVVNPRSSASYTVRCVAESGCISPASASKEIEVINLSAPQLSTAAYAQSICKGTSTTLTAANCNKTVIWSSEQRGSTISVGPAATTSYTALCEDRGCKSPTSTLLSVTVFDGLPKPAITADRSDLCAGQSATLRAEGSCVGVWKWSNNVVGAASIVVDQTNSYQLRCTLNDNCESNFDSKTVTMRPTPSAPTLISDKANNEICHRESMTITASTQANHSLVWGQFENSNNSQTISPAEGSHVYSVRRKSEYGCESTSTNLTIKVKNIPVAPTYSYGDNPICDYQKTNLTANGCDNNGQIHWTHNANLNSNVIFDANSMSYQASCERDGCISTFSTAPTLEIRTRPVPPTVAGGGEVCAGGKLSLTATAIGKIYWSNGIGNSMIEALKGDYTAYQTQNGCQSLNSATLQVIEKPIPAIPADVRADKVVLCYTENTILRADAPSGVTLLWDNNQSGTPTVTAGNYRVKASLKGCESDWSGSVSIIKFDREAPVIASDLAGVCGNNTTTIRSGANTVKWYQNDVFKSESASLTEVGRGIGYRARYEASGCVSAWSNVVSIGDGTPLAKPLIYYSTPTKLCGSETKYVEVRNLPAGAAIYWSNAINSLSQNVGGGTYTVYVVKDGCLSPASDPVTFTQVQIPAMPTLSVISNKIMEGQSTMLSAGCENSTLEWTEPVGFLGGWITPPSTTTYKAKCADNGCKSEEKAITVEVCPSITAPSISIQSISVLVGTGGTLTVTGCTGGTISWLNNSSTLASITVGVGSYTAICRVTNGCGNYNESQATGTVSEYVCPQVANPSISIANVTVSQGTNGTLTVTGCTGGTISWLNNSSTEASITVGVGSYTAICRVTNGCGNYSESQATGTVSEYVCPQVANPSISIADVTVNQGANGTLTVTGCTGGTISWLNSSSTEASITVGVGSYTATCKVTNGCGNSAESNTTGEVKARIIDNDVTIVTSDNISYIGKSRFCDEESSTPKVFSGCVGGEIRVQKDGATYLNSNLVPSMNYSAQCYRGNVITSRTSFSIAVGNKPIELTISPNSASVNRGQSIELMVTATGANSYRWSNGGDGDRITVSPESQTNYSVVASEFFNYSGCQSSVTKTVNVTVTDAPTIPTDVPTAPPICPTLTISRDGNTLSVTATEGCNTGFTWYKIGAPYTTRTQISTESNVNISVHGKGQYEVKCGSSCGDRNNFEYVP